MVSLNSPATLVVLGIISLCLYLAYRAILPKPIAGIPYNKDAAGRMLGDIPEMIGYVRRTKRIFCWLTSLNTRHQSPIVQVFTKPGGLPWVVVTDPYESQDILLRRIKDFDRSDFFGQFVGGIMPYQHSHQLSTDDQFKYNRKLINHLMAPTFINQISAPQVYSSTLSLIKLWRLKCKMASGRPFSAHHDITFASLDSIFASSFGLSETDGNTFQRLEKIKECEDEATEEDTGAQTFPEHSPPAIFSAILTLAESVSDTQLSPAPALTSWIIRKFPYMRNAKAIKDKFIRDRVTEGIELIQDGSTTEPKSAIHSVLLRELELSTKEGRQPNYYSPAIADEFFGFMTAGYDTSATTIAWGVKMLTDNPIVQNKLRDKLRDTFSDAALEKRTLAYHELSGANIPYLDAVVDEVLRHSNSIGFVARQAQRDTTVLGRHIPKGTNVWLMANGPGYLEPNISVDDQQRSPGARQESKSALTGLWDDGNIAKFLPERWLEIDSDTGAGKYNSMAGPSLPFGMGLRGCYGKRLALQVLRIHFALIVWHFELLSTPAELSSYDAVQKFAREPTQCYVRLREVE
nr:cytochrome P450 [Fusarium tricinctum]